MKDSIPPGNLSESTFPKDKAAIIKSLSAQIGVDEEGDNYAVCLKPDVQVGENPPMTESGPVLVLEAPKRNDVSCLKYNLMHGWGKIKITLVQKVTGLWGYEGKGDIAKARAVLGVHPHQFLVGNFIKRIKPILEAVPETEVIAELAGPAEVLNPLRDRFFDKKWRLNLDKKKVREILGENLVSRMKQCREKK